MLYKHSRGFTLIETIVTIGIIAILAGAVYLAVGRYNQWAKDSTNQRTVRLLNDALARYKQLVPDLSILEASVDYTANSTAHNQLVVEALKAGYNDAEVNITHQFISVSSRLDVTALISSGTGMGFWFSSYAGGGDVRYYYTTCLVNQPFTYVIPFVMPSPTFSSGNLPSWLTLDPVLGKLTGTPVALGSTTSDIQVVSGGTTYNVQVQVQVVSGAPVINSNLTAAGNLTVPFTYTITATNSPTSFNATGLPAGLTVDTATGVISGTPTAVGGFAVQISATNANGTSNKMLSLTITGAAGVPSITSALNVQGQLGVAFSYTITATNDPTSFSTSGMPVWLSNNNGALTGTPPANGTYVFQISAINALGTDTKTLTLLVASPPAVNVDVVP